MPEVSTIITPLQAWHVCTSIKLHFEDKIDAVKYNFKMPSLTPKAFEARKDRYFFEKLARQRPRLNECVWYVTANVLADNTWVGEMKSEPYNELVGWHQSAWYRFESEMKQISERFENFDDMLERRVTLREGTCPPPILTAFSNGDVSIHSIAVLHSLTGFLDREMKEVTDPLGMWNQSAIKVKKYCRVLNFDCPFDMTKMRKLVIEAFTSTTK